MGICIGWVVYAHRNPGSRAGIWLVEHRPTRVIQDSADYLRRKFYNARSWLSSTKSPSGSSGQTSNSNGMNQNGGNQSHYDVSVGGVTLSASRI